MKGLIRLLIGLTLLGILYRIVEEQSAQIEKLKMEINKTDEAFLKFREKTQKKLKQLASKVDSLKAENAELTVRVKTLEKNKKLTDRIKPAYIDTFSVTGKPVQTEINGYSGDFYRASLGKMAEINELPENFEKSRKYIIIPLASRGKESHPNDANLAMDRGKDAFLKFIELGVRAENIQVKQPMFGKEGERGVLLVKKSTPIVESKTDTVVLKKEAPVAAFDESYITPHTHKRLWEVYLSGYNAGNGRLEIGAGTTIPVGGIAALDISFGRTRDFRLTPGKLNSKLSLVENELVLRNSYIPPQLIADEWKWNGRIKLSFLIGNKKEVK